VVDYLKLHFVILLWGFTAVLGNLIELSATQIVFYRSALASLILATLLRRTLLIDSKSALLLIANGMLLGGHWILFFWAVKISSVSVCMIGMATISLWTAILEPILIPKVRFKTINLILGVISACGVILIFGSQAQFQSGIILAIASGILSTLFSIFNGQLFDRAPNKVIVTYEMAGSAFFCAIALAISQWFDFGFASDRWLPQPMEWVWLLILVLACTIYAYRIYVQLLNKLSVFTINFSNNLEPVYGIVFGALLFQDHQQLTVGFYIGATIIFVAILAQPWLSHERVVDPVGH
jgi:drug/metabolite transporter (DMT)-like permease